jgi:sugar lactone lactonase YvrE
MTDADFRDLFARVEQPFEPRPEFVARLLSDIDAVAAPSGALPDSPGTTAHATTGPDRPRREPGYLVAPEVHQMVALAKPHAHMRRAIAVLGAVAAVIVAAVAVAVTRPSADHQTKPVAPTTVTQPGQVVPPLSPATVAQPQLYWEDGDGIGRANLDGTGITRQLIPVGEQTSCGTVAADRNYVYWTVGLASSPWAGGGVARARRDGTGVDQSFITLTPYVPQCVAVGGGHVYWTGIMGAGTDSAQWTIGRANLDGTGVKVSLISGINPQCLVVDGAHVYWCDSGAIGRANLDGTGVNKAFISPGLAIGFCCLLVDGAHIYWGDAGGIGRANLDGTGINVIFIPGPSAIPVPGSAGSPCAQDGTYLYWISTRSGSPGAFSGSIGSIGRARLDGTGGVQDDFITGLNSPSGCAIGP